MFRRIALNLEHGLGWQIWFWVVWRVEDGLSEGGSRWCDSLGAINRSRFGGWFRARAKEEGMKGGGASAAGMRPKKWASPSCVHCLLLYPSVGKLWGIEWAVEGGWGLRGFVG